MFAFVVKIVPRLNIIPGVATVCHRAHLIILFSMAFQFSSNGNA
jgi:hypothetical protein